MDDAVLVGLGDGLAALEEVVDGVVNGEHAKLFQRLREVGPLEVLHQHVGGARVEGADVGDANDVLTLDLGGDAGFPHEAGRGLGVLRVLGEEELQRDALVEGDVPRLDHEAHAALADDALDAVLPGEDRPRHDGCIRNG